MASRVKAYHSPLREEQAKRTRARILESARAVFRDSGYAASTLADVARQADVAESTVRAVFKTKRKLLEEMVVSAVRGGDAEGPLAQRETFQAALAAPNGEQLLERVAAMTTAVHERSWDVIEIVNGAAGADPDIATLLAKRRRARRSDQRLIALRLQELGELPQGTAVDTLADVLWVHTAPEIYRMLVIDRRWPQHRYRTWLHTTLSAALAAATAAPSSDHRPA